MINFRRSYSADEIIRALARYDTVSFDIFDTLIKRCVARPRDVFHRVARDFTDKTGIFIDPAKFRDDRHNAEIFAERNTAGREETTLQEIYACLPDEYSGMTDELMTIELQRELKCCRPDPVMRKVYEWCRENHKRIFIISDMYLPLEVIQEILSSCGYEGYEKLYLSSDIGLRKTTGNIFRHFINDSGIDPKRHIHIGDAWRGDYLRALQAGLKAYKITRYPARSKYTRTKGLKLEDREQYAKYQAVTSNHVPPDCDEYYRYGFEVLGLMLYGLCCWLHERFTEKGHDKVFFLARDGYIMQEAYNLLFGDKAVKNSYLYVSRKSLRLSMLWTAPTLEGIFGTETQYMMWHCDQVCSWLGLDYAQGLEVWESCGLPENEELLTPQLVKDSRVQKFFEAFRDEIISISHDKFTPVADYLRQEGFSGSVGIVDIGWVGHIQKYLREYVSRLGMDTEIYGWYFGLKGKDITGSEAESFIPHELHPSYFCSVLLEYPFTKQTGSVKGYTRNNDDTISPELEEYEFAGTEDEKIIGEIQRGALDFISIMRYGYGYEHSDYSIGYSKLRKVAKFPSLHDANILGELKFTNEGRISEMASPSSILHYVIYPRDFRRDFFLCGWPDGFLKRLLKLPLPYDSILTFISGKA
ncbi:MAG: hypothetical protein IJP89_00085 [Synergistaceae bacterium]|nr:hypothetical protein [Synergistaceae bacterium]